MKKGNIRLLGSLLILLLLASCSGGAKDLADCESVSQSFMDTMAEGNVDGALKYCDTRVVQRSNVSAKWTSESLAGFWINYKGLEFTGKGAKTENGEEMLRLEPVPVTGNSGYTVDFVCSNVEGEWKVRAFKINPPAK